MLKHAKKKATLFGTDAPDSVTQVRRLDIDALEEHDSLESQSRLTDSMKSTAEMAQWWDVFDVPSEATLEASYEESRKKALGGDTSLMDSHKSKRKKSYMEKAKIQTVASQHVKSALGQRATLKVSFLDHVKENQQDGEAPFTVPEQDAAFFEDWCAIIGKAQYDQLKNVFSDDEQLRKTAAHDLLLRVNSAFYGLDQFEFDDDKQFMANFAKNYPILCAASSADKLLDILDEGMVDKRIVELRVRIQTLKDIREAYENRMQILQSPYYALLLESDLKVGDKQYEALKAKMQDNPGAKAYFEAVEKRGKLKFGKGVKTEEILQKNLESSEDYTQMRMHKTMMGDYVFNLTDMLQKAIPSDPDALISDVNNIVALYKTLNDSLASRVKELESKKKLSKDEKAELALCKERLTQFTEEQLIFETASSEIRLEKITPVPGVWENVLYNIRAERLNPNDPDVEEVGGGASKVYKVKQSGVVSFVKREERLLNDMTDSDLFKDARLHGGPEVEEMLVRIGEFAKQMNPNDMRLASFIRGGIMNTMEAMTRNPMKKLASDATEQERAEAEEEFSQHMIKSLKAEFRFADDFWRDFILADRRNFDAFVAMIDRAAHKKNEFDAAFYNAKIDPRAYVSDRNASTSIMAQRLHITPIVAKSKTVIVDNGDGTYSKANSMEQVKGVEFGKFVKQAQAVNGRIEYSPEAMGQLFTLQVFDMICGQVDRHAANFMVTQYERQRVKDGDKISEVWVVKAIKAIDNDMSFGKLKGEAVTVGQNRELRGFKLKDIENGQIKFLPADFVQQVRTYTHKATLVADFADTRTEEEIDALYDRILEVKARLDERINSTDKKQKIWVYSSPEELATLYQQLQSEGVLSDMKAEMSKIAEGKQGAYMDWSCVRDVPDAATVTREKLGDEEGDLVVEKTDEATYLADGDVILETDIEEIGRERINSRVSQMFIRYRDTE